MAVIRLTVDNFDQIFDMYKSHTTFQGLPRIASIYNETNWDERWYNYHLISFDNPRYYWFGDVEDGIIKSFIQYETWIKNGEQVVSNGFHISNKTVIHKKSYGQKAWSDSLLECSNYAVDFFEAMNIYTAYSTVRGKTASPDGWIAASSIPQSKLYYYKHELVEEVPAGMLPVDIDLLTYVIHHRKTIAQTIYKSTKIIA